MTTNVFVLGLDDFHRRIFETVRDADRYAFHGILDPELFSRKYEFDADALIEEAEEALDAHAGSVDAIVEHWDFPTSTILPILREHCGLPGPSLEAVLKCEHKYWSRLEQRRAVPDLVPRFAAFDPFADDPRAAIDIDYPFWVKPVKAHSSHLGFKVDSDEDMDEALAIIRDEIGLFARPLNQILARADLPDEVRPVDGFHCLAEKIIPKGRQCTLEGYVQGGETHIYGVVDSLAGGRKGTSLLSYQYPSLLAPEVQDRMAAAAAEVMEQIGFDGAVFNVEFFHHEEDDGISLLEINPRVSKSHTPLFALVDGASNHQVAIRVAMGEDPAFPHREGEFPCAAKYMMRHLEEDAYVESVPDPGEMDRLREEFPELRVRFKVREGVRLSDQPYQEPYSYDLAELFLGGRDRDELRRKYEICKERLPLTLRPAASEGEKGEGSA